MVMMVPGGRTLPGHGVMHAMFGMPGMGITGATHQAKADH